MEDIQINNKGIITKKEIISYGLASPGVNIGALICASFLSAYFTDVAGIPVAAVGLIFLIARIFDGFSDIIMGAVIDKTRTKWGKAKPWIFIGGIGSAIVVTMLFNVPQIGKTGMIIYALVTYFLFSGVFNTMTGVSVSTSVAFISDVQADRTALGASFFTTQTAVTLILSVVTLPVVTALGGGQKAWTIYMIVMGIVGLVFLYITLKNTKERFAAVQKKGEKLGARNIVKSVFTNQYFILITLVGLFLNAQLALTGGVGVYYASQILKNPNAYSIMSIAMYLPKFFAIPMCVPLVKRFGKGKVAMVGLVICACSMFPMLVVPENIVVVFVCLVLKGVGTAPLLAGFSTFVAESADYGRYKSGLPIQGIYFSGTSFGNKMGAGIGGAILGWVLAFAGYEGMASTQTASALEAIKLLYVFGVAVPAVIMLLLIIPFKKLEKMQPEIHKKLHVDTESGANGRNING